MRGSISLGGPSALSLSSAHQDARCAVIGAGIAGATATRVLKEEGLGHVALFDKGRSLGGRVSSRVIDGHSFEFGASLISLEPSGWVDDLRGFAPASQLSFYERDSLVITQPGEERVMGLSLRGGIGQLVELQAACADQVERSARITRVERECGEWWLYGTQYQLNASGDHEKRPMSWGPYHALIIAIPGPQVAQLLFPYKPSWAQAALKVRYEAKWALSLCFEHPLNHLPELLPKGHQIGLIREARPVGSGAELSRCGWVVQGTSAWSEAHLEEEKEVVMEALLSALKDLNGGALPSLRAHRLHRWRYATPRASAEEAMGVLSDRERALWVAGDWTCGPNGGWAYMSGLQVARKVAAYLSAEGLDDLV